LELTFRDAKHNLHALLDSEKECPASSLKVLGYPLIVRNVNIAQSIFDIDTVSIPDKFSNACTLVQNNFPAITVNEFYDSEEDSEKCTRSVSEFGSANRTRLLTPVEVKDDSVDIPINSLIHNLSATFHGNSCTNQALRVDLLTYPWDFLNGVQTVLHNELTRSIVSPNVNVATTSLIRGPCLIENDVIIDDFCKIIGPTYIGSGSFIGMSSLVRKSVLGCNTRIGFSCEIGRSFFEGHDMIAHQNVILDSIIGEDVWFGGYSGTVNVTDDRKNVRYQIGERLMDTGTDHFGAVIGNHCAIGASVTILPGRQIPPNTVTLAGTVIGKKEIA
jgi:acetyltransferase-like isoleucine patch superfamily enzyme